MFSVGNKEGYEKSEGSVSGFEPGTYRVRSSGNHS
jgi:hypothetical protein